MPNRFCQNTDIVRAGASRHSYQYGQEWFEADWWASMSMCTNGVCGSKDLNEWVASAGQAEDCASGCKAHHERMG
jgi:hypothetical protein